MDILGIFKMDFIYEDMAKIMVVQKLPHGKM